MDLGFGIWDWFWVFSFSQKMIGLKLKPKDWKQIRNPKSQIPNQRIGSNN